MKLKEFIENNINLLEQFEKILPIKLQKKLQEQLRNCDEFKNCELIFVPHPSFYLKEDGTIYEVKPVKVDSATGEIKFDEDKPKPINSLVYMLNSNVVGKIYLYSLGLTPTIELPSGELVNRIWLRFYQENPLGEKQKQLEESDCYIANVIDRQESLFKEIKLSSFNEKKKQFQEEAKKLKELLEKVSPLMRQYAFQKGIKLGKIKEVENLITAWEGFERLSENLSLWDKLKGFYSLYKGKECSWPFIIYLQSITPLWIELETAVRYSSNSNDIIAAKLISKKNSLESLNGKELLFEDDTFREEKWNQKWKQK